MMNKLFTTLKYSGAIAVIMFIARSGRVNSTEYVFSAPPEVDNEIVEIPTQEADYPFYECEETSSEETSNLEKETANSDSEDIVDSHDCDCLDCKPLEGEVEGQEKLSSRKKQKK